MLGSDLEALAVERPESPNCRFAQVHRLLKYGVEDRREITERGIDDPQHFRGCGLLVFGIGEVTLQRVAFGSARSQLRFKLAYGPQCIDQSCFALVRHLRACELQRFGLHTKNPIARRWGCPLNMPCERPSDCASEKRDELAPFESTELHLLPLARVTA